MKMNRYFVDFEIYNLAGTVVKWGNLFYATSDTDIVRIADLIYAKISKNSGFSKSHIRFRQFNKI